MNWPDQHDVVAMTSGTSSDSGPRDDNAAPGESGVTRAAQALLVFVDPVTIDCERRKWPVSFQRLFNTGRLSALVPPETDVHIFTSVEPSVSKSSPYAVHLQKYTGVTFGERLEYAVEHLAGLGYGKIVIVGSDCPGLSVDDIANAYHLLDHKRLVLGPDHRGGCYLIGLHREDRAQLSGIRWHQNTDCAELLQRYGRGATAQLTVKIDLDTLEDLRLLAKSATSWSIAAAALLQILLVINSIAERFQYPLRTVKLALSWQLPPPLLPTY
jgi:2-phospho-L-lactate guanylyltransferase (CobY/MobA/RfbA family)